MLHFHAHSQTAAQRTMEQPIWKARQKNMNISICNRSCTNMNMIWSNCHIQKIKRSYSVICQRQQLVTQNCYSHTILHSKKPLIQQDRSQQLLIINTHVPESRRACIPCLRSSLISTIGVMPSRRFSWDASCTFASRTAFRVAISSSS